MKEHLVPGFNRKNIINTTEKIIIWFEIIAISFALNSNDWLTIFFILYENDEAIAQLQLGDTSVW